MVVDKNAVDQLHVTKQTLSTDKIFISIQSMILTWGARRGTRDEAGPPEKVAERLHLRFHTELGDVGEETT